MAIADYVLCVYPTQNDLPIVPGRTDRPPFVMSGAWTPQHRIEMHIAATESAWTFSHEFGRCIGLFDENSHPAVGYFKPDKREGLLQRLDAFTPANHQGGVTPGRRNSDFGTLPTAFQLLRMASDTLGAGRKL